MIGKPYRSYVAIGDSLSEGLGDFTFHITREHNGWTDRLAGALSKEANDSGYEFHYANLALRGSKLSAIMHEQLRAALRLQPDLVTVMAGSNDLLSRSSSLDELREIFRNGILELLGAGCDVVIANTINPIHLKIFRPLSFKASKFSQMLAEIASEFELPLLDVHGIADFSHLSYWAKDMVHFSGYGHIVVANRAAELLGLKYRFPEPDPQSLAATSRGFLETLTWLAVDVVPFFERRLRGVSSGDGMQPKHSKLQPYSDEYLVSNWNLVSS